MADNITDDIILDATLAVRTLRKLETTARNEYLSIKNTRARMRPSERAMALADRAMDVKALAMGASALEAMSKAAQTPATKTGGKQ